MMSSHPSAQAKLDLASHSHGPVECLGLRFRNQEERREHFRAELRKRFDDQSFRDQQGFPDGSIDDIIEMSDPPYYTACPNPFLPEIVAEIGKPYEPAVLYARSPLAIDVSVGKGDPLYKAHAYHTKVPHLAIVPSILHYTRPGDIVLDAFCGSGMTGLAAQWCGSAPEAYRKQLELAWAKAGRDAPAWGARHAILNDLSPAATFIASNQNIPFDGQNFVRAFDQIIADFDRDLGWMYLTRHSGDVWGRIEYTLWSQEFTCPECASEIQITQVAANDDASISKTFRCPDCDAHLTKRKLVPVFEAYIDQATGENHRRVKFTPELIVYRVGKNEHSKVPDAEDLAVIARINELPLPDSVPTGKLPLSDMYHGSRLGPKGVDRVHRMFLPRPLQSLGYMWERACLYEDTRVRSALLFVIEQAITTMTLQNRYQKQGFKQVNKFLPLVYYIPSRTCEVSPHYAIASRAKRIASTFDGAGIKTGNAAVSTGDCGNLGIPDCSIDYVFTDPPFGENIFYADLNLIVEEWHGVKTSTASEAIIDNHKEKDLLSYQSLMERCFAEYFRVLKPGRWMTVVFSNSRASVWNAIQVSLQQAGFVVAEVTALDKMLGSYRQVTSTSAVKQDLVVSCYKPNGGLEDRFVTQGVTDDTAWDFVRTHLNNLAVVKWTNDGELDFIAERDPRRVFDRMVAWFVRHNTPVPLSSAEFKEEVTREFLERDGMLFLTTQVDEYERARLAAGEPPQRELFVDDERSAIDWVGDFLRSKPATYQDIHPEFTRQIGAGWRKHEQRPELQKLLDDNFLQYDGDGPVPPQIHGYLSSNWKELRSLDKTDPTLIAKAKGRWYVPDPAKQQDVEKRREKTLLKEFEVYRAHRGRKLKEVRLEVLRAGFKTAWANRDYQTIIDVAAKVTEDAWQEDEKLLTFYDMAETRLRASK